MVGIPSPQLHQISSSFAPFPSSSASSKPKTTPPALLKSLVLAVSSAASVTVLLRFSFSGGGGDFSGGSCGSGGANGGEHFLEGLFSSPGAIADESQDQEWDSQGLTANIVVQLSKLSGFKKDKISELLFFDQWRWTAVGTEDSFKMVSIRPGGIYTKSLLLKELEILASCGMFEKVAMEGKTKPDGTLALTISFTESTWQSADRFRCINVGLIPQTKPIEMDPDMTDKEKMEYYRSQDKDYRRRIERARPVFGSLSSGASSSPSSWAAVASDRM